MESESVLILDFGGQYKQLIARRIRAYRRPQQRLCPGRPHLFR